MSVYLPICVHCVTTDENIVRLQKSQMLVILGNTRDSNIKVKLYGTCDALQLEGARYRTSYSQL